MKTIRRVPWKQLCIKIAFNFLFSKLNFLFPHLNFTHVAFFKNHHHLFFSCPYSLVFSFLIAWYNLGSFLIAWHNLGSFLNNNLLGTQIVDSSNLVYHFLGWPGPSQFWHQSKIFLVRNQVRIFLKFLLLQCLEISF